MTVNVYRDTACTVDADAAYELWLRLTSNGYVASSWSDGTTRTAGAGPSSASDLSASNSYWVVRYSTNGRWITVKRTAANNWLVEYTSADGTMAGGNGTTPDRDATYTKIWLSSAQFYPSTGTTTTKAHTVVDSSTGSFVMFLRRSPNVGGSTDGCSIIFLDVVTPLTWGANPDPAIGSATFSNSNVVTGVCLTGTNGATYGWYKKGISGASYIGTWFLENPGNVNGNATTDPSGSDLNLSVRWVSTSAVTILGVSTIFNALNPYRNPTVGIDAGSTLSRAAFGGVSVLNDGVALGS